MSTAGKTSNGSVSLKSPHDSKKDIYCKSNDDKSSNTILDNQKAKNTYLSSGNTKNAMIFKQADFSDISSKQKNNGRSSANEHANNSRKKLSFYNEDDDSDGNSSPTNSKRSNLPDNKSDKTATVRPVDTSKIAERAKVVLDHVDRSEGPSQGETSSTSSCSCEDHSSVAEHDDLHGDLDYDEGSISGSPARKSIDCKEKLKSVPTRSSSEANNQVDESNMDSETIQLSVNHSISKSPESIDDDESNKSEPTDLNQKPRIKSIINFNHNNDDGDLQSHRSSTDEKSPRDKSHKSYDHLLRYFFKDACYFQIKSINHENVDLSKSLGVWSTPIQNEIRLNSAFKDHRNVILVFSVQQSGGFQGFARMVSEAKPSNRQIPWILPERLSNKSLGGVLKVEWLCTKELPFHEVNDLFNPFNDNKPVKVARDGQQVEPRTGKRLCKLFPPDSKDRLLSCLATLKRHISQRKKSSHRRESIYPFVDRKPGYQEDRFRADLGFNQGKNDHNDPGIINQMGHDADFSSHSHIYRPMGRRGMLEHSNYGIYPRQSLYPTQFSPMRPFDFPRHINGGPRYPEQRSHQEFYPHNFMPPFNHHFPGPPFNAWNPTPDTNRYHPYQRSRR